MMQLQINLSKVKDAIMKHNSARGTNAMVKTIDLK